jgi:glycosyltransferase involved in cell wall biosynthesis
MHRYRDVGEHSEWRNAHVELVWQHHDIFHTAGHELAHRHRCPLVSYVHAPQVWEAARWGVRRPGWGRLLEQFAERPQLLASDVVAVVSEEVAREVERLGVNEERVLVSPMAVDPDRFSPAVSGRRARDRFGLDDAFVVGWTGSFRRFHGLELAIEAFGKFHRTARETRLLLVGDGAERSNIEALARACGIGDAVVFAGAVAHEELPVFVAAMDATVVTARAGHAFHYSPLKMREYLASARAVVAPNTGDIARTITDGMDGLLYEPGDVDGMIDRLHLLHDDARQRERLGIAGRELMLRTGTWSVQLQRLLTAKPFRDACARLGSAT